MSCILLQKETLFSKWRSTEGTEWKSGELIKGSGSLPGTVCPCMFPTQELAERDLVDGLGGLGVYITHCSKDRHLIISLKLRSCIPKWRHLFLLLLLQLSFCWNLLIYIVDVSYVPNGCAYLLVVVAVFIFRNLPMYSVGVFCTHALFLCS